MKSLALVSVLGLALGASAAPPSADAADRNSGRGYRDSRHDGGSRYGGGYRNDRGDRGDRTDRGYRNDRRDRGYRYDRRPSGRYGYGHSYSYRPYRYGRSYGYVRPYYSYSYPYYYDDYYYDDYYAPVPPYGYRYYAPRRPRIGLYFGW